MDLKKLISSSKTVDIEYPGVPGLTLTLQYLGKDQLRKLRDRCTTNKFDRKTRQLKEELDQELFVKEFASAAIKGWEGLTMEKLSHLVPMEYSSQDSSKPIPYTVDNAIVLIENSSELDSWLNDTVFDLENFRKGTAKRVIR